MKDSTFASEGSYRRSTIYEVRDLQFLTFFVGRMTGSFYRSILNVFARLQADLPFKLPKINAEEKKLPKNLVVSFLFLTFAPDFRQSPYGEHRKCSVFRLSLFMEKRLSRFVSDPSKSGKFQSQSGLSNDRCSCKQFIIAIFHCMWYALLYKACRCLCWYLYKLTGVGSALPVQLQWVFQNLRTWDRQHKDSHASFVYRPNLSLFISPNPRVYRQS